MAHHMSTRQVQGNIAFPWWDQECSVVPIRTDGTKRPTMPWQALQHERLTEQQVMQEWGEDSPFGVAVICGAISGGLEMLELEGDWSGADSLFAIEQMMDEPTLECWKHLLSSGYVEWTPSGGLHFIYRVDDHDVPGNTKIAQGPDGKTRAETRGTGGYVIVAPTGGNCHPSGEAWEQINGGPETIMDVPWETRCAIHDAIKAALDDSPPPPPPRPARVLAARPAGAISVGDDFNARADWAAVLEPNGWKLESTRGMERLWTRPGKETRDGASASTDYQGKPGLFVWSTSAGLPSEEPLSKLFVLAHYEHGGDMRAAVKRLAKEGFGTPLAPRLRSDTFMGTDDEPSTEVAVVGDVGVPSETTKPTFLEVEAMDDSRLAELYHRETQHRFMFVPERNKWMYYDGGVWHVDVKNVGLFTAVTEIAQRLAREADQIPGKGAEYRHWAKKAPNSNRINAAIAMMVCGHYTRADDLDADRNLLNLTNGTLDLTSLELLPHDPTNRLTKQMGAGFNPEAKAPGWDKYLDEVLPDKEVQDFLQRMVGYSLLGKPVERALAVLHGPGGTGKSRFIEMLSQLMGTYGATAAASLFRSRVDDHGGPSNDLHDLRGARLASVSELDPGVKMSEALVKRLTGLDRITSRALYAENETWLPQCVIWIASNHHFRVTSDDGAIWQRIKVIPFVQEIQNKDPHILDKLMQEADGILNWMIEGILKYRERGLASPQVVDDAVGQYKLDQDTVMQFINDSIEEERLVEGDHETTSIKTITLYRMYEAWCLENKLYVLGSIRFYARLLALGKYPRERKYGTSEKHFFGITAGARGALGTL